MSEVRGTTPGRICNSALLVVTVGLMVGVSSVGAQRPLRENRTAPASSAVDSARLGKFIDSLIGAEMQQRGIPGAAFVLVQNGRVVYTRGYGLARVQPQRSVDATRTIWRVGSISKTFTATATALLADRGAIHLGADANLYLKRVQIPATYPLPVTVADLLMHTAGLDEIRPGTQVATAGEVLTLADFLKPRLARIRPPGNTISYSTYGVTVAGALIEDVSGTPFETFLQQNIWQPLGMTRTSITVPLAQQPDVAVGYERLRDSLVAQPWEWYHTTPASSVNSTLPDMAKYMIAHLEGGRIEGRQVWSKAMSSTMLRQHVTMHPRIPGVTLGFFEDFVGNVRVVEHEGNMAGFSSLLTMIPSERTGFFLVHHFEDGQLRAVVREALLRWLYPAARERHPVPAPPPDFASRAEAFVGRYAWTTSCHTCSPRRVSTVLQVTARDNSLVMSGKRWIEVEPLLFVREDGTGYLAFQVDSAGKVIAMYPGSFWSFEKLPQ